MLDDAIAGSNRHGNPAGGIRSDDLADGGTVVYERGICPALRKGAPQPFTRQATLPNSVQGAPLLVEGRGNNARWTAVIGDGYALATAGK